MVDKKKIVLTSTKYLTILTMINVIVSLFLSTIFSGGFDIEQVAGYVGDLGLLDVVVLLLTGASVGLNAVVQTRGSDEDRTVTRVPDGRGRWYIALIGRRRVTQRGETGDSDGDSMERTFTYFLCGTMFIVEIVVLATITGY